MYSSEEILLSSEVCMKILTSKVSCESALISTVNSSLSSADSGKSSVISRACVRGIKIRRKLIIAISFKMCELAFCVEDVNGVSVFVPDIAFEIPEQVCCVVCAIESVEVYAIKLSGRKFILFSTFVFYYPICKICYGAGVFDGDCFFVDCCLEAIEKF